MDEDDILNPDETIERQRLGIDMDYLVKHLGQGDTASFHSEVDESKSVSNVDIIEIESRGGGSVDS